jgi:hypothetical protein
VPPVAVWEVRPGRAARAMDWMSSNLPTLLGRSRVLAEDRGPATDSGQVCSPSPSSLRAVSAHLPGGRGLGSRECLCRAADSVLVPSLTPVL